MEIEDSRITEIKEIRDEIAEITLKLNEIISDLNELQESI